jgi:hypothetical protein
VEKFCILLWQWGKLEWAGRYIDISMGRYKREREEEMRKQQGV